MPIARSLLFVGTLALIGYLAAFIAEHFASDLARSPSGSTTDIWRRVRHASPDRNRRHRRSRSTLNLQRLHDERELVRLARGEIIELEVLD